MDKNSSVDWLKLFLNSLFSINGPWTIAGFGVNVSACARAWDEATPWMKDFPEY